MVQLKVILWLILSLFCVGHPVVAEGPFGIVKEKYEALSDQGKAAAGAAVGFVGTRLVLKSAFGALKIATAAFITAEVLSFTGALDNVSLSEDQRDVISTFKARVVRQGKRYTSQLREKFSPESFQSLIEKEKAGALGVAGGAILASLL